jgi:hypothetical protein
MAFAACGREDPRPDIRDQFPAPQLQPFIHLEDNTVVSG